MLCPCCSGNAYQNCCLPFISGDSVPDTPEQLMRSRFSAYASAEAKYIIDTYSIEQRAAHTLDDISAWAEENKWIKLIIHSTDYLSAPSTVEFSAFYINQGNLIEMRECSNFVKQQGSWRYQDGDIIKHDIIQKLARNDVCPCNSGKKYKKCCGK
ncbi:YchJ family protein [Thalassotalea euphylliae]|uniref:YchJ family protein n=1 Tax=Thalassotalea euphylliae TaxID=1655234 RepID=UPI0036411FC1